jgi:hypothetical protein
MSHPRLFPETDIADSADRYTLAVQPGDIIVAGSDGLFDNLWEEELLELISEAQSGRAALVSAASGGDGKMKRSSSFNRLAQVGKSTFKAMKRVASTPVVQQEGLPQSASSPSLLSSAGEAAVVGSPGSSGSEDSMLGVVGVKKVVEGYSAEEVAERAAKLLAKRASGHAADKEFKSPWAVAAGKTYGLMAKIFAKGGKMDDVTVVVAVVQDLGAGQ